MFGFLKRFEKIECYHDWVLQNLYYEHELTEYTNGSDSIKLYRVFKCMKCLNVEVENIDKKYYPLNNHQSQNMKREYLELLKGKGVKPKEEWLLNNLNN